MRKTDKRGAAFTRRQFLGASAAIAAGVVTSPVIGSPAIIRNWKKPYSQINGVRIGTITYSFRSMVDQSAEATLQYIKDCGISEVELMGGPAESFAGMPAAPFDRRTMWMAMRQPENGEELTAEQKEKRELVVAYNKEVEAWRASVSMDKFEQVRKMYRDAGVNIYAFKPRAFGPNNTDAEIDYGFKAAKSFGASHVTVELPENPAHSQKLGKFAAKHKIYMAYHGHEQQTPTAWDTALNQSEYNAMNLDLGHYVAAGNPPPFDLINAKSNRIKSMHIKDRQTPVNGKGNKPWGEGDTPIVEVLQLMKFKKYQFPATIELEYEIPKGSNAVKEVAKCLEYCRKALEG
jgi:sugar phosphate isomerase/epimerase